MVRIVYWELIRRTMTAERLNQQPSLHWRSPKDPEHHRNPAPPCTWSNREAQPGSSRRENGKEYGGLLGNASQELMCRECWENATETQSNWVEIGKGEKSRQSHVKLWECTAVSCLLAQLRGPFIGSHYWLSALPHCARPPSATEHWQSTNVFIFFCCFSQIAELSLQFCG